MSDYASAARGRRGDGRPGPDAGQAAGVRPGRRDRRLLDQGLGRGDLLRPADVPAGGRRRRGRERPAARAVRHRPERPHNALLDSVLRRPARAPQPGRGRRARHLLASRRAGAAGRPAPPDPAEADRGRHRRGPRARVRARVAHDRRCGRRGPGDRAGDDRPRRARARARVDRAASSRRRWRRSSRRRRPRAGATSSA